MASEPVTTLHQDRTQYDVVALFLVAVMGFAAWRGSTGAPILSAVIVVILVACGVIYVRERRRPGLPLHVSRRAIVLGAPERPRAELQRRPDEALVLVTDRSPEQGGFYLAHEGLEDGPRIPLLGFPFERVREVLATYDWPVVDRR